MLVQETTTDIPPPEVIQRAREFFTTRFSPYAVFEEGASVGHIVFRGQVGELIIGVLPHEGRTRVRGSTSRMAHELSKFLLTLAPAEKVRQNLVGPGTTGAG